MKGNIELMPVSVKEDNREAILYEEARTELGKMIQNIKNGRPFSIASLPELVSKIIDNLLVGDELRRKAIYSKGLSLDIAGHLLNVCIFAVEIGMGLRYPRFDLERLGLAAIVHDIGMARVPENILKKPGRLTEEEFAVVKEHPEESFAIMKSLGGDSLWIAEIIAQEHERYDGRGYPRGLKGNEIHEYALIIGMADVYEALTHNRFQRKNLPPFDSLKEILSVERSSFPEKIIKAVMAKLPVFPVGTMVRLSSKEIGIVVASDNSAPFRPTVEIVLDTSGRRPKTKRIINLQENTLLYIVSLVSEEEIHAS